MKNPETRSNYNMSGNTSITRFISAFALAFVAASLFFPPTVSALPLSSGGGGSFGWSHNDVEGDVTFSGADWTANAGARTVSLNASTATCTLTDLDFNRDGILDDDPTVVTTSCSFNYSIAIPTGGLGNVTCNSDVRTYTAYCEPAQFNLGPTAGMTGALTVNTVASGSAEETVLMHAGCINPAGANGCTWDLGSLPEKNGALDQSKFGCIRALPAGDFSAGGAPSVHLNTGQLLKYSESFAGSSASGNCTTGTLVPGTEQGIRMCFGEADSESGVTDCQREGNGNNTLFHVLLQQNGSYTYTVSRTGHVEQFLNIAGCSAPGNSGTTRFIVYGESQFDVHTVDLNSMTAHVVGTAASASLVSSSFADDDGDGIDDLLVRFNQCDLGATTSGVEVIVEIEGTAASGTLPWNAFVSITTN